MDPINLPLPDKVNAFVNFVFGGVHHVRNLECKGHFYQIVPWGSLSTYDGNSLTKIVIAAHDLGLRADVENHGIRGVRIILHDRSCREGPLSRRHPTLEQAIMSRCIVEESESVL